MNKISKKLGKKAIVVLAVLVAVSMIASATLLTYFNEVDTNMEVEQSVLLDGMGWDSPVTHDVEAIGGCCYCYEHTILNQGCQGIWLDWTHTGNPDLEGIDVLFTREVYLGELVISALDGMAEYDDFTVSIDGQEIYVYYAEGGDETWITHNIDLTPYDIPAEGTHTVKINCIADEPWEYFWTYGQLGIDTIDLYCELGNLIGSVDIGDETSEAGHNLQGWGPIEPATHGGNWGGIDNCRATWIADDESWATVDFVVELCENCDCDGVQIMTEPFYLEPQQSIDFCICYELDMLIAPGTYHISSKLVPSI